MVNYQIKDKLRICKSSFVGGLINEFLIRFHYNNRCTNLVALNVGLISLMWLNPMEKGMIILFMKISFHKKGS